MKQELSGDPMVPGGLPDKSHHKERGALPSSAINWAQRALGAELQAPSLGPAATRALQNGDRDRHRGLRRAETTRWSSPAAAAGAPVTRSLPHDEPARSQTPRGNFGRSHGLPAPSAADGDVLIRNSAASSAENSGFRGRRARAEQLQQHAVPGAESLLPPGRMLSPGSCLGSGSPRYGSCSSGQRGRSG